MPKMIFVSFPVSDLQASTTFYEALGFRRNPQMSDATSACMVWSEAIQVMLLTHEKWRTFTDLPLPPPGTAGIQLSLSVEDRATVDAICQAAAAHGGRVDVNPVQDLGFMYGRDLADPDGNLWGPFWMDPAAMQAPEPATQAG